MHPVCQKHLLTQAFTAAQEIRGDLPRVSVLAALIPRLPDTQRTTVLSQALNVAYAIENNESRVRALVTLAPHLANSERAAVLSQALEAARTIDEDDDRAQTLCVLLPHLSGAEQLETFTHMLDSCLGVRRPRYLDHVKRGKAYRGFLLQQVAKLAGVLADMGGESAVKDTVRTIRDTASWWP